MLVVVCSRPQGSLGDNRLSSPRVQLKVLYCWYIATVSTYLGSGCFACDSALHHVQDKVLQLDSLSRSLDQLRHLNRDIQVANARLEELNKQAVAKRTQLQVRARTYTHTHRQTDTQTQTHKYRHSGQSLRSTPNT